MTVQPGMNSIFSENQVDVETPDVITVQPGMNGNFSENQGDV